MNKTLTAVKSDAAVMLATLEANINDAIQNDDLTYFSSAEGRQAYDLARILKATIKAETFKAATMDKATILALPLEAKAIVQMRKEKGAKAVKGFLSRCARVGL